MRPPGRSMHGTSPPPSAADATGTSMIRAQCAARPAGSGPSTSTASRRGPLPPRRTMLGQSGPAGW
jgi:hypothetical protein